MMVKTPKGLAVELPVALFLGLRCCVVLRDRDACRIGLRRIATELEDDVAMRITQTLSRSLDPQGRFWLANVLGERLREVEAA